MRLALLALLILSISLCIPGTEPPSLVAGTDLFWETYEATFSCTPCPTEDKAIEQLEQAGWRIEK